MDKFHCFLYAKRMNNTTLSTVLGRSGLTDKEAAVYSALLELGGGFPSKIADHARIKRSTTYRILLELSVKGLANEIKKRNKVFYQPESPEKLVHYGKTRIRMAEDQLENIEKIVPELRKIFSAFDKAPKIRFFEGPDAVKKICVDMISEPKKYEMLAFSNAKLFKDYMPKRDLRDFIKGKERLGITTRGILPDTAEDRVYDKDVFSGIRKDLWPIMRFVPKEDFPYEAELTIYGQNKVSITKLTKDNVIGIIIEDDTIHGMMRMIFEIAWKQAKV